MYYLAISNKSGDLFEEPGLTPMGRSGKDNIPLSDDDFIPLPPGSSLSMMIDRIALGRDKKKRSVEVRKIDKQNAFPVAAIIPPGYTRTYLPAYKKEKDARILPFFAYTAMAIQGENIFCAAIKTHEDIRWDPTQYSSLDLAGKIKRKLKAHKKNRLLKHLSNCSVEYKCFTAQNIFYDRWEGGIPVSPVCNARCGGCISENRINGVPSPQDRIKFIPTVNEIVEIAVPHLETKGGIISFGQGCEGEPLMKGKLIADAIRKIRQDTDKGTININTNASLPDMMSELFDAGLDSMRVSLNSAIEERYQKYFRPVGYKFGDVIESIKRGKEKGIFISLNHLFLPGINDREEERDAFFKFLEEYKIDMIQIRNLNIDPDYYFEIMGHPGGKSIGVKKYLDEIKSKFPDIKIGNFSIPLR
ncbi:MAG: radical SAM protein [Candidatus Eremiobacteraeota bacterium]|nr:radical SAM protein [Candidatus Eremiobacteraeota bacterium]